MLIRIPFDRRRLVFRRVLLMFGRHPKVLCCPQGRRATAGGGKISQLHSLSLCSAATLTAAYSQSAYALEKQRSVDMSLANGDRKIQSISAKAFPCRASEHIGAARFAKEISAALRQDY